ncbi:unnamed protein product [Schistosoma margrebowiei]|uniref:Uncharacterized protein n=1 Tax=Schistosoma margrebowiei TaxID=48269 RepID=A0A183LTG4_9TREM|nr:unnamed protein product [Schistosoma margrebowiei]
MEFRTHVSLYSGLVRWICLHHRVDVHSRTRTQYRSLQTWLAVESRMRVSSYLRLVSWMYLHLRVDVHLGTRTQYHSL